VYIYKLLTLLLLARTLFCIWFYCNIVVCIYKSSHDTTRLMSHSVHVSLAACRPSYDTTKLVWPSSFNVEVVNVWSVAIFPAKGNANDARGGNWTTRLSDGLGRRRRSSKWGWRRSPGRTMGVHIRSVDGCYRSTSVPSKTKVFIERFWSRLHSESSLGKVLQSSIYCTFSRNTHNKLMNSGTIHVGCCDRKK